METKSHQVANKAKRVFELMSSQDGNKAYGSVMGTDILITIERVGTPRPEWWPEEFEWPPTLSDEEANRYATEEIFDALEEVTILLPCPFCGMSDKVYTLTRKEKVINSDSEVDMFWVECLSCESRGPLVDSSSDSKHAWNNRRSAHV